MSTSNEPGAPSKRTIDPLLAKRLDRLGSPRTGGGVGGPLPPPTLPGASNTPGTDRPDRSTPTTKRRTRRVKPARASKLAALSLSLATTAGLSGWFARVDAQHTTATVVGIDTSIDTATTPVATTPAATTPTVTTPAATNPAATTPATTTPARTTIADGTYTGVAANTEYGPVQVAVVYQNGSIVDVTALDYPTSNRKDQAINSRAVPRLITDTLSVQSANVDTVSGATYTSNGYRASLQSAIDAAKQASGVTG